MSNLIKYDPFAELNALQRRYNVVSLAMTYSYMMQLPTFLRLMSTKRMAI